MEEFLDRFNCKNTDELVSLMKSLRDGSDFPEQTLHRCEWCFRVVFTTGYSRNGEEYCNETEDLDDDTPIPKDNILFDDNLCYGCCEKLKKKLIISDGNIQDSIYDRKIKIEDYAGELYKKYLKAYDSSMK